MERSGSLQTLLRTQQLPSGLSFRPLQPSDFAELKALHNDLFPIDYDDGFFNKAVTGTDRLFSYAAVATTSATGPPALIGFVTARMMYAYECDPTDRHYLGLGSPAVATTPCAYILTLGVAKAWQHQGIARLLLQHVHAHAHAMRWHCVFLHVISYNHAAIRLYASLSYTQLAQLKDFYTISSGRQPIPDRMLYDAYLFGLCLDGDSPDPQQGGGGALGWQGAMAWNMAMAPIRNVLGHVNTCMPWLNCNQWLPKALPSPLLAPFIQTDHKQGLTRPDSYSNATGQTHITDTRGFDQARPGSFSQTSPMARPSTPIPQSSASPQCITSPGMPHVEGSTYQSSSASPFAAQPGFAGAARRRAGGMDNGHLQAPLGGHCSPQVQLAFQTSPSHQPRDNPVYQYQPKSLFQWLTKPSK